MSRTAGGHFSFISFAVLFVFSSGCYNQDHAPLGNTAVDGSVPGGGGGGGGGGGVEMPDSGEETDSDDTDTQTNTDSGDCASDEILQPQTNRCWRRCPVGQEWVDSVCVGSVSFRNWSGAVSACPAASSKYRTATRDEMISVLGNCDPNIVQSNIDGLCDPCAQSSYCFQMFEFDSYVYWTSTATEPDSDTQAMPWGVSFAIGTVFQSYNNEELHAARCLRNID